ncbi:hypothetical protein STEG23_001415 [Scotinomys teguina]
MPGNWNYRWFVVSCYVGPGNRTDPKASGIYRFFCSLDWDHLDQMPYTTMCIKEALRLYPPVPGVSQELNTPVTFPDGRSLPKGITVAISIYGLHHNPSLWPNPKVLCDIMASGFVFLWDSYVHEGTSCCWGKNLRKKQKDGKVCPRSMDGAVALRAYEELERESNPFVSPEHGVAKMGRRQCKSAYNIIKNKTTPESSPPPTPKSDYCNADKAEENDLKKSLMKMLEEAFEEKMKNVSKEIGENTNKNWRKSIKKLKKRKAKNWKK